MSTLSERQPLGTVPSINLSASGKEVLLGRSSCSSHHQLSANRAISRVHVRAIYRPASEDDQPGSVVVECLGWNGCKVHCGSEIKDLEKGESFVSQKPLSDLMLDVQDCRVMLRWPSLTRSTSLGQLSEAAWEDESPSRRPRTPVDLPSSPPLPRVHLQSPVSPSPRNRPQFTASTTFIGMPGLSSPSQAPIEVYEDASGDEANPEVEQTEDQAPSADVSANKDASATKDATSSSSLSELDEFSDKDEENDPIIHSFGPSGANLLPRMASMTAVSPDQRRRPLKLTSSPQQSMHPQSTMKVDFSHIRNHVVNQLAYGSRNSLPLSAIMSNLPASMKTIIEDAASPTQVENKPVEPKKRDFTDAELKRLLEETACVGEIAREGKDAAGKKLEDEFYYVPQMDTDEGRRNAVEHSLGKTGLRSVRKQHKVCKSKSPKSVELLLTKFLPSNTTGRSPAISVVRSLSREWFCV